MSHSMDIPISVLGSKDPATKPATNCPRSLVESPWATNRHDSARDAGKLSVFLEITPQPRRYKARSVEAEACGGTLYTCNN
jgi:hypothetical protein